MLFRSATEAVNLSTLEGFSMWRAHTGLYQSYAKFSLESHKANAKEVVEYARLFRQTGSLVTDCSTTFLLSSALHYLDHTDEALNEIDCGLKTADCGRLGVMKAELLRLKGEILASLDKDEAADRAFREAIQLAQAQGARSLQLRAINSLIRHRIAHQREVEILTEELHKLLDSMHSQHGRPEFELARGLLLEAAQ